MITRRSNGFTLVEILVVTGIIGILSALSLQILTEYRRNAFDSRALTDLRHISSAEEAYFATFDTYKTCTSASDCAASLPALSALSPGVRLAVTATTSGFSGTADHPQGSGRLFRWESFAGGLQQ